MSLLQDVRHDVPENLQATMITRFLTTFPDLDVAAFRTSYAILGAHRHLRIAGVFSRLARRDGNRGYLDYLPRVWRYIAADLRHPALAPVADWLARFSALPGESVFALSPGCSRITRSAVCDGGKGCRVPER